jgi:hypothetical protein
VNDTEQEQRSTNANWIIVRNAGKSWRVVKAIRGQLNLRKLGPTLGQLLGPGAAPFLVSFPHNPDFVGREVELASLHEMLQQRPGPVGIRPTVLVGLGGIGKTQLAPSYRPFHGCILK